MATSVQPALAVVTGASSGIGLELAKLFARDGYDLFLAADRPLQAAADAVRQAGGEVVGSLEADLSTRAGVDELASRVAALNRPVAALCANAGHGLAGAFLDQDLNQALNVAETNVLGTTQLIWHLGRGMRAQGAGRILITSSTASQMPGPWAAMYFGSKAFLESFGQALRVELKDAGVSVTLLLPGAAATEFFAREQGLDTKGAHGPMDSAADVARTGYAALLRGDDMVIHGEQNQQAVAQARQKSEAENAEQSGQVLRPGSAG